MTFAHVTTLHDGVLLRRLLAAWLVLLLWCATAWLSAAHAQFRVEVTGVGATQLPISVAKFRGEDAAGQAIATIVRQDLERSGVFKGIDTAVAMDELSQPAYGEWRARAVDALVAGSVTRLADGRFDVRFKLWDVVKGVDIGGQSNAVQPADLRLAAHKIADYIYQKLTGEPGVFSTRIAFVAKAGGRYTLHVADADGEGRQTVLSSAEPIISPVWSPDDRELAYVSFETQKPAVYAQDVQTGRRRVVANFKGSNSAPAWSPDGQTMAVTLSRDGSSQIYLLDRQGGNARRLMRSGGIDTEPTFAPDGRTLYFVSDRGGSPQIYRTSMEGGNAERVTFSGNYNISPAVSPDGRHLAYISRQGGAFKLYVMPLDGGPAVSLTDTSDDESPSFAPNGKLIIYATRAQGRDVLMTTTLDGRIKARLASPNADVMEPVWGPARR